MQNISEDILIRASKGDLASFEEIYKASAGFVYNVAFRIVNNREDAEEVTQEVFCTIYHKLKSFRFASSFKTWVYRVTANSAINFAKKAGKHRKKMVEYDEQLTAQTASPSDTRKEMDREHNARIIGGLLSAIDPDQRACVVLRNIEGLSYQEIAQTLRININTVRSRLKRAREKLLAFKKRGHYERLQEI